MSFLTLPLKKVSTVVGRGITPSYAVDGDVTVLNQRCVRDGRVDFSNARRHDSNVRTIRNEKRLCSGDILINSTGVGTLGRTARLVSVHGLTVVDSHVTVVRANGQTDSRWLAYVLSWNEPQIEAMAEGSTGQTELSQHRLAELQVLVPPLAEQRGIAATLGALDDKIESNKRIVDKIGLLFAAEFSSVQEGATSFVELREIVSITKGVSYRSADLVKARTSLVTLKSFDRNGGYKAVGLKPYVGPYKESQVIRTGELIVAQTDLTQGAEVVGRAVRVPRASSADVLVASLDLAIVRPLGNMPEEYLYGLLTAESFREHCRSRTSGTTVLHLAGDAIPQYRAPLVPLVDQERFAKVSHPLIERSDSLEREIECLIHLRDTLLPELLSGRIRVPEAQEAVETVV